MNKTSKKTQKRANQQNNEMKVQSYTSFQRQSPVAQRMRTVLRYSETYVRSGLALYDYQFRLNGLQDPNYTGTGHQPKGFDQLASLYQRYRVYRTKWEVTQWLSNSAIGAHLIVVPTNSNTSYADASDAIEQGMARHEVCSLYQMRKLRGIVDLAMLNGKTHAAYSADDTTQALVSTNPTEVMNLHVFAEALDGSTTILVYQVVTLEYDVEFSDPVQLGQS